MGFKVLVVDDAPFIREAIREICLSEGHSVIGEAENGNQAVELAVKLRPEVIIMDLVMPQMSGLEAAKEILKKIPGQPIIACSTLDQNEMIMKAIEAGCVHYVVKPFQRKDLAKALAGVHKEKNI